MGNVECEEINSYLPQRKLLEILAKLLEAADEDCRTGRNSNGHTKIYLPNNIHPFKNNKINTNRWRIDESGHLPGLNNVQVQFLDH